MSKPFFIWTMRRTGGTSLTDMLMKISEYKTIDHEPFLLERELGYVTKMFMALDQERRTEKIEHILENVFDQQVLIKHCYEILGAEFNRALVETLAQRSDYKHIFLLRKDEVARMLSLMLALQTDVWGKHGSEAIYQMIHSGEKSLKPFDLNTVAKEEKISIESTEYIKSILEKKNIEFLPVFFEDLYTGKRENRISKLETLFSFLEFGQEQIIPHQKLIEHTLFNRSQKSHSVLNAVPNLEEVKSFISAIPEIKTITQFKKKTL